MLSGGSVFDGLDYSFSVGHEDGSDAEPNGPGGGSAELRRRLRILREFLQGLPLVEMAPDMHTVKHAAGVYTHMLSSAGGEYAMYVDGDGAAEIVLDLPAGEYALTWVNVASGEKSAAKFRHVGGEKTVRTSEVRGGVAMLVSRVP
jgi:hypothetical protein